MTPQLPQLPALSAEEYEDMTGKGLAVAIHSGMSGKRVAGMMLSAGVAPELISVLKQASADSLIAEYKAKPRIWSHLAHFDEKFLKQFFSDMIAGAKEAYPNL